MKELSHITFWGKKTIARIYWEQSRVADGKHIDGRWCMEIDGIKTYGHNSPEIAELVFFRDCYKKDFEIAKLGLEVYSADQDPVSVLDYIQITAVNIFDSKKENSDEPRNNNIS